MEWLHDIFQKSPESALFLSLAVGYAIGKITFGRFQLGGVAGSLLAAVVISQFGVEIDNGVKAVMFAVFIYAVGYESGPQFFNSLNRSSLREIAMAVFMAVCGLVTVVVLAKLFHLDKGLAAGLAAGGMTQSAIIGTAGDAITKLGLLIGLLVWRIGSIPLTLGAGGGALLSGLVFGWARSKHKMFGAMPTAACQLLKDFGLAAFVAIVGINSGLQAVSTLRQSGLTIFILGAVVTLLPLFLTMLFGRYVLRYDNAALLAGALSGSRSANPAFGGILDKAESPVPTVPFAITYALANVLLTLLGPLVVGLV